MPIKHKLNLSDEETVQQIQANTYPACATNIGFLSDAAVLMMGVWPPKYGLQGRASNNLMLLRLRGVVVSGEEKAVLKLSCKFKEDERKRTVDEASKWVKMLSKSMVVGSTPISSSDTRLRLGWQLVYRRHDL